VSSSKGYLKAMLGTFSSKSSIGLEISTISAQGRNMEGFAE